MRLPSRPVTISLFVLAACVSSWPATTSAQQGQQQASAAWLEVMRSLHDPNAGTRLKAVESLNLGGYAAAADPVAPLIGDPDVRVRFAAIDAEVTFFLADPIGSPAVDGKAQKDSRPQLAFDAGPLARNSAAAPSSVTDALAHALDDTNPRIRFDALHALGFIAEPPASTTVGEAVMAGLDAPDPTTRIASARVLGRLRVTAAGDKLIAALNDTSLLEQQYATEALGLIGERRALTSLLQRLDFYQKGELAAETLLAVARIADDSSRPILRARLGDGDPQMRTAALEGLGRLRDEESRATMTDRQQKDKSPAARLAATYALGCFGDPDVAAIVKAFGVPETWGQAYDYLIELGPAAVPAVQSGITTARDARVRADLLRVFGRIATRDAVSFVEPFTKDKNERVARAAADAMTRLSR
jgi:HEAT repeat protein